LASVAVSLWAWPPARVVQTGFAGANLSALSRRAPKVVRSSKLLPQDLLDQPLWEVALDVRELLITDANVFFVGPDLDQFEQELKEVAELLNYTYKRFNFLDPGAAMEEVPRLEQMWGVPPLIAIQRWPWAVFKQGIIVWLDTDGLLHADAEEKKRRWTEKFGKPKQTVGPRKPTTRRIIEGSDLPPGDPYDMYDEADVHVDIQRGQTQGIEIKKLIMGSMVEDILKNPPMWRTWMKEAKAKGSVPTEYVSPIEERRRMNSFGVSPRLQKLLTA